MVSDNTKATIKKMAEEFGKEPDEIKEDFKEAFENPLIAKLENREEMAINILRARYASDFGRPTHTYQVYVLQKTAPKEITKKDTQEKMRIANVYGLAINPEEGDEASIRYTSIAHFNNLASHVEQVDEGKAYEVKLSGGIDEKGAFKLSGTETTRYKEIESDQFGEPLDMLRNKFERVEIAEADLKAGSGDLRLIEGTVSSVAIVPTKKGTKLGIYKLIDDSLTAKDMQELGGGLSVMCDPGQVRFGQYSQVAVLGFLSRNEQYGTSMNAQLIMPIVACDYEPPKENITPEETGLDDDNSSDDLLEDTDL